MLTLLGIVALIFILILIYNFRKASIANQNNTAWRKNAIATMASAESSAEELKGLIVDMMGLLKEHMTEKFEDIVFPIPPGDLEGLILKRLGKFTEALNAYEEMQKRYEKALLNHLKTIETFIVEEILNGRSKESKTTKRRLKSSRKNELDISLYYLRETTTPLAFYSQDVSHLLTVTGETESENCIAPVEILQDLVQKKFSKGLRTKAEELLSAALVDYSHWKSTRAKYNAVSSEKEQFENFLADNQVWLDSFFALVAKSQVQNAEADKAEASDAEVNNAEADKAEAND